MEFTPKVEKSCHEAIKQSDRLEMFNAVEVFAKELSRKVDSVIIAFLDEKIGPEWEYEKVEIVHELPEDKTIAGMIRFVMYDGKPVGKIRQTVAVQENRSVANFYIEMAEIKEVSSEKRI